MKSDITKEMTKEQFILALMNNCGYTARQAVQFANKVYGE